MSNFLIDESHIFWYNINQSGSPDKAKPSVRRGQKATGLIKSKMVELPKDEPHYRWMEVALANGKEK